MVSTDLPSAPSCLPKGLPDFLPTLDAALRCCFCCSFSCFSSFFCSLAAFLASVLEGVRSSLGLRGTNSGASGFSFEPLIKSDRPTNQKQAITSFARASHFKSFHFHNVAPHIWTWTRKFRSHYSFFVSIERVIRSTSHSSHLIFDSSVRVITYLAFVATRSSRFAFSGSVCIQTGWFIRGFLNG